MRVFTQIVSVLFCGLSLLTFGCAEMDTVAYRDCGSTTGTIKSVSVNNCPSLPCDLKKGNPQTNITQASSQVFGYIFGVKTPFPLPEVNACDVIGCPVTADTSASYTTSIYVDPSYPEILVVVQWELQSPDGMIVCFTLPTKIVP